MMPSALFARQAAFAVARLGWVGWVGLCALLSGALALLAGTPLVEHANARQHSQIAALQAQLTLLSDPKTAQRARDPLAALVASLPAQSAVADFVAAIQRRAEAAAVQIDRTEYRVQPVIGAAQRYRLRFPAHADYPHLRVWLEGLLHDYPNLSLDEISLRREVDGGEELEASIGLSFLTRDAR